MILAAIIGLMAAQPSGVRPVEVIKIDYRGTCGSTLIEQRRREAIERRKKKLTREFNAKGVDVRFVAMNSPGHVVGYYRAAPSGTAAPIFNRNFSC